MGRISIETSYLYANPSLIGGMAKTLDLGGNFAIYNDSKTPIEADMKAMENDWKAVGKDLTYGIREYEQEKKEKIQIF